MSRTNRMNVKRFIGPALLAFVCGGTLLAGTASAAYRVAGCTSSLRGNAPAAWASGYNNPSSIRCGANSASSFGFTDDGGALIVVGGVGPHHNIGGTGYKNSLYSTCWAQGAKGSGSTTLNRDPCDDILVHQSFIAGW